LRWRAVMRNGPRWGPRCAGHADANLSILRRTALSLLQNESTQKTAIKNKRLTAGWTETYLEKVLHVQELTDASH